VNVHADEELHVRRAATLVAFWREDARGSEGADLHSCRWSTQTLAECGLRRGSGAGRTNESQQRNQENA
jgi:hypothetical protein